MKENDKIRNMWIIAFIFIMALCAPIFANGEIQYIYIGQRENGQDLTPIQKYVLTYEDTTASTCYSGQNWCCKTSHTSEKLMHWHNVDTELTSLQASRADAWLEFNEADPDSTNRISSASIYSSCHSYAFRYSQHLLGYDQQTILDSDYYENQCPQLDDLCKHNDNHTSIVNEVGSSCNIIKVESKWGFYGVYITNPSIYGGINGNSWNETSK
jgi:hypothetical protein